MSMQEQTEVVRKGPPVSICREAFGGYVETEIVRTGLPEPACVILQRSFT